MQLFLTLAGLEIKATLPDTAEARAVYEAVKRGDLSGMSFAFKVPDGGDRYDPNTNTNTRTITKIEKVLECSVVPFPAYPTTSVEARSKQESSQQRGSAVKEAKSSISSGGKSSSPGNVSAAKPSGGPPNSFIFSTASCILFFSSNSMCRCVLGKNIPQPMKKKKKDDGNLHAHVMLTMRPFEQDGSLGANQKKGVHFRPGQEENLWPEKTSIQMQAHSVYRLERADQGRGMEGGDLNREIEVTNQKLR